MAQPNPSCIPELCVNCGMPPCKRHPTLPITILFSKATKQVLCVEANKDFIDTLFGFLTLPLGGIIKLFHHHAMIHHPSCLLAPPPPSTPLIFPPDCPYTPAPKKTKNDSSSHFAMSSISNVFDSVARLDPKEMSIEKSSLVDPKPAVGFGAGKLVDLQNEAVVASTGEFQKAEVENAYFGCGNACSFYAMSRGVKCPKHKKKLAVAMKDVMKGVESASDGNSQRLRNAFSFPEITCPVLTDLQNSNWAGTVPASASASSSPLTPPYSDFTRRVSRGLSRMKLALPTSPAPSMIEPKIYGYVKEGTKYMVTNTLEIYASAEAIKALIALDVVRCERVGDLDTMPVSVVTAEVLQLLKLSFTSTNVLHDVFGKYCADIKTVVFQEKAPAFFPKCVENPCCYCSRMGTPRASPDHTSF